MISSVIRLAQDKIKLSPAVKAKTMKKLKSIVNSYVKANKDTKSAKVMTQFISKFEANIVDKLNSIIKTLKDRAINKKPAEEITFEVKNISLLIQDLEEIAEAEKAKSEEETTEDTSEETEEEKEKKAAEEKAKEKKEKKKDKEETEDDKEKKETGDEEEESKFKELLKVCDGYKKQLEKSDKAMSKFKEEITHLKKDNEKLNEKISKFEEKKYTKLLNATVEKVSKFKKLNEIDTLALKEKYLTSKMSETALDEIGRVTDNQMFSKLEVPKETTKPSEMLGPVEPEEKSFSKLSKKDQLEVLAGINAKNKGFVSQ